ncbi:MAG: cellulase family glycosylhydrolase [Deltaproteobacteria bacterium]|nr:cellulase family glycosylhydrolase [Deltaproteobacteria bacterium]
MSRVGPLCLALALLVLAASCAGDGSEASPARPVGYHLRDGLLRDPAGRALILRGINIPNDYDQRGAEKEIRPPAEVFRHIADSGFDAVRLVIEWYQVEAERGVYDEDYLELVRQHVQWADEAGLYVFVDMHQDMFGRGFGGDGAPLWACDASFYESYDPLPSFFFNYFSPQVRACFQSFWTTPELRRAQEDVARAVADRIEAYEHVLGFDPVNEPSFGTGAISTFERELLMPFHAEFASRVGEVLPGRAFFFEPTPMFSFVGATSFAEPVTGFVGVFAPHYYNVSVELAKRWDGNTRQVRNVVGAAADTAARLGVPWVYGEMGGDKSTPNLGDYLLALYGELDARMAGSFLWLYEKGESGFGLIDTATNDWTPHARAFLRPAPAAVAGTPLSFEWTPSARRFVMTWEADPGAGETEVILPAWVAAAGFDASLDGLPITPARNAAGNRLVLRGQARGQHVFELVTRGDYPG